MEKELVKLLSTLNTSLINGGKLIAEQLPVVATQILSYQGMVYLIISSCLIFITVSLLLIFLYCIYKDWGEGAGFSFALFLTLIPFTIYNFLQLLQVKYAPIMYLIGYIKNNYL